MESLRLTRLFPALGNLDERRRRWLSAGSFGLLFAIALLGAAISPMREMLVSSNAALTRTLTGQAAMPLVVHMSLAFLLPFALAFAAIPLQSLVESSRTVAGMVLVGGLRVLRVGLNTVGAAVRALVRMVPRVYDLLIFAPLWIERMVLLRREAGSATKGAG